MQGFLQLTGCGLALSSMLVWGVTGSPVDTLPLIGLALFFGVLWLGHILVAVGSWLKLLARKN